MLKVFSTLAQSFPFTRYVHIKTILYHGIFFNYHEFNYINSIVSIKTVNPNRKLKVIVTWEYLNEQVAIIKNESLNVGNFYVNVN